VTITARNQQDSEQEKVMIQFTSIDPIMVTDLFLMLLIGIGPTVAFVPFLTATAGMGTATRWRVVRKMLATAGSHGIRALDDLPRKGTRRP
jgi:hypothetical protein